MTPMTAERALAVLDKYTAPELREARAFFAAMVERDRAQSEVIAEVLRRGEKEGVDDHPRDFDVTITADQYRRLTNPEPQP